MNQESYEKANQFRLQIRRKHIQQLFSKRRRQFKECKMVQQESQTFINKSVSNTNDSKYSHLNDNQKLIQITNEYLQSNGKMQMNYLKVLLKISETLNGIKLIKKTPFPKQLQKYLSQEYLNSVEQLYSLYIICNIYYEEMKAPSQEFVKNLFVISSSENNKIRQLCLCIFFHMVHDLEQSFLQNLVQPYSTSNNLVQLMAKISRSDPTASVVRQILRIVYCLTRRLGFSKIQPLQKLKKIINITICSAQNLQMVYLATLCLLCLSRCFPEQKNFIKGVASSLTANVFIIKKDMYTKNVLTLIKFGLEDMEKQQIQDIIFPFLYRILQKCPTQSSISAMCYSIIYEALIKQKISKKLMIKNFSGLVLILMKDFDECQDQQALIQLIYIFGYISHTFKSQISQEQYLKILSKFQQVYECRSTQLPQQISQFVRRTIEMMKNSDFAE